MNNIEEVKINIQNEFNYYMSMKALNSIKDLIPSWEYSQIKEKFKSKYEPVFAIASEVLRIENDFYEDNNYEKNRDN